jgi:two-component system response regulator VicR
MIESSLKVVCIEDAQEMVDLVTLILGRQGIQVTGAIGGREGLKKITEIKPDLVLIDLSMPEMDGWEVYQSMQSNADMKDIPVIIVTAKSESIDKALGLRVAHVDDYVTKPFSPEQLVESVNRVMDIRKR